MFDLTPIMGFLVLLVASLIPQGVRVHSNFEFRVSYSFLFVALVPVVGTAQRKSIQNK